MDRMTPAQFGIYSTTTTLAVGILAYLVLQFADYVDELTCLLYTSDAADE